MKEKTIGFAMCGSFCTVKNALNQLKKLKNTGAEIVPIMSPIVYSTDTRFITSEALKNEVESITENKILTTIEQTEPIGPKKLLDLLIIAPCTGNTLSKISSGITDTSVTMAAKANLRNNRPVVIALATNDALSGSAQNIGKLLNTRNIFFVPFGQDDPVNKPTSLICDFEKLIPTVNMALNQKQLQPILV